MHCYRETYILLKLPKPKNIMTSTVSASLYIYYIYEATVVADGHSGAARGGGAQGARPPHRMSGGHIEPAVKRFFLQNFTKKTFYHIWKMKWPKSE